MSDKNQLLKNGKIKNTNNGKKLLACRLAVYHKRTKNTHLPDMLENAFLKCFYSLSANHYKNKIT